MWIERVEGLNYYLPSALFGYLNKILVSIYVLYTNLCLVYEFLTPTQITIYFLRFTALMDRNIFKACLIIFAMLNFKVENLESSTSYLPS